MNWLADWLARHCAPAVQRKIGLVMCIVSIPLIVYGPWSNEQFLIYEMSAFALLFAGLSTVVAAVPSEE